MSAPPKVVRWHRGLWGQGDVHLVIDGQTPRQTPRGRRFLWSVCAAMTAVDSGSGAKCAQCLRWLDAHGQRAGVTGP